MNVKKNISNHPEVSNLERTAFLSRFSVDKSKKEIVIDLVIKHYYTNDQGEKVFASTIPDRPVKLKANNSTKVELNGDILYPGQDGYDNGMGEFDFFEQFPIQQGTLSGSIYPIIEKYISKSDSRGRFGKNIYL